MAGGQPVFVWLSAIAGSALVLPIAMLVIVVDGGAPPASIVRLALVSGALHTGYWLSLNRGYRTGDLSLVYPLARGGGSLLSAVIAVALLAERPSILALTGAAVIVCAVLALAGPPRRLAASGHSDPVRWALFTSAFIAAYTLWDQHAVGPVGVEPIVFYAASNTYNAAFLTPFAVRDGITAAVVRAYIRRAVMVGGLAAASYIPILYVLQLAPVSLVAPAREVSVLLGAALGIQILNEPDPRRRLLAAAAIAIGISLLAVS
jgi:uncharacterized membrane protein